MKSLSTKAIWTAACLCLAPLPALAEENSVAEFTPAEAGSQGWRVVDDGVMGGLSKGKIQISEDGILNFSGKLSLENNGGFSSLRTDDLTLNLSGAEGLLARVKGDGRTYQMRFSTEARFRGMEISFMAEFETTEGEWVEVKVPFEKFSGSFRGMSLAKEKFDPGKIRRVGILLGDKKAGPFELQVDWIRTYGAKADSKDIVSTALADGRFGTLATALTEAKLVETLQGKGPFTVFAPTDEAFSKLPKETVESLLKTENRDQLITILSLHAVPGNISAGDALNAGKAKSLSGGVLQFGIVDGLFKVNGVSIVKTDIVCDNGRIHVIDAVLLPQEKGEQKEPTASSGTSVLEQIEDAIDQGVPVFNGGDAGKCADIYRNCMVAISKDPEVDSRVGKSLRALVQQAEKLQDDHQRAWLLRSGLDQIYSILSGS